MIETMEAVESRPAAGPRRPLSDLAAGALVLAVVSGVAGVAAGFGTRIGVWDFRFGFALLRWAANGGVIAVLLAVAGGVLSRPGGPRRGLWMAVTALVLGVVVAVIPWGWSRRAQAAPPIHDITTDMEDPPQFVAVLPLREAAPNPSEYGGAEVAAQQLRAYPNIRPAILPMPADQAFERALAAARRMDWEIVAADPSAGRIEATETTFWFGFKDDVVIRVREAVGGSRVDVRSVSRVGRSDVGTNARRVRAYLNALAEEVGGAG